MRLSRFGTRLASAISEEPTDLGEDDIDRLLSEEPAQVTLLDFRRNRSGLRNVATTVHWELFVFVLSVGCTGGIDILTMFFL